MRIRLYENPLIRESAYTRIRRTIKSLFSKVLYLLVQLEPIHEENLRMTWCMSTLPSSTTNIRLVRIYILVANALAYYPSAQMM